MPTTDFISAKSRPKKKHVHVNRERISFCKAIKEDCLFFFSRLIRLRPLRPRRHFRLILLNRLLNIFFIYRIFGFYSRIFGFLLLLPTFSYILGCFYFRYFLIFFYSNGLPRLIHKEASLTSEKELTKKIFYL